MVDSEERFSMRELELMAGNSTCAHVNIGWLFTKSHAKRLELVRMAVDHVVDEMAKSRHLLQEMTEDQLTYFIISQISKMGPAPTWPPASPRLL